MTPRVSIVWRTPVDASDWASVVSQLLRQCDGAVELLLCGSALHAALGELVTMTDDPRVRVFPATPGQSPIAVVNSALRAATGEWVAFADPSITWASDHLEHRVSALRSAGRRLLCEVADSPDGGGTLDLGALCVSNICAPAGVVCARTLLDESGLFDESLPADASWDLWLRLVRVTEPLVAPATTGRPVVQATTAHALLDQLVTTLRVHHRVADLARELPGITRRQWEVRRILGSHVDARLQSAPSEVSGMAGALTELALAALRLEERRDLDLANRLIERALAVGLTDEPLRRIRLRILRALGQPERIVLALGDMRDTSHRDVLVELAHALRQLGQVADASAVEGLLGGSITVPSTPPDVPRIAIRGDTAPVPSSWPAWMPRGTADASTWARAAQAYVVAGLPAAAHAAMQRAIDAGHVIDADDQFAAAMVDMDRELANALGSAVAPLTPVRLVNGTTPPVFLPLDPERLEPGPFHAVLADEVLAMSRYTLARQVLSSLAAPGTTYVDLVASQEATPLAVLASAVHAPTFIVLRANEPAIRRFQAGVGVHAPTSIGIATSSEDEVLHAITGGDGPVLVHASLTQATSEFLSELLARAAERHRPVQILWSDTDTPSVGHHTAWSSVEALTEALGLHTHTVSERDGVLRRGSLREDPRPQLLHTC
jgi:hypothetical protein